MFFLIVKLLTRDIVKLSNLAYIFFYLPEHFAKSWISVPWCLLRAKVRCQRAQKLDTFGFGSRYLHFFVAIGFRPEKQLNSMEVNRVLEL